MKYLKKVISSVFSLALVLPFGMKINDVYAEYPSIGEVYEQFGTMMHGGGGASDLLKFSNDIYDRIVDPDEHLSNRENSELICAGLLSLFAVPIKYATDGMGLEQTVARLSTPSTPELTGIQEKMREVMGNRLRQADPSFLQPIQDINEQIKYLLETVLSDCYYSSNGVAANELFNKYKQLPGYSAGMSLFVQLGLAVSQPASDDA